MYIFAFNFAVVIVKLKCCQLWYCDWPFLKMFIWWPVILKLSQNSRAYVSWGDLRANGRFWSKVKVGEINVTEIVQMPAQLADGPQMAADIPKL